MLHTYYMPHRWRFTVQYLSVGCVPITVICLLTFVTTLDAAALNRTAQEVDQILPADQLQPSDVKGHAQESKVDQIGRLHREQTMRHPKPPLIFGDGVGDAGYVDTAVNMQALNKSKLEAKVPHNLVPLKLDEVQPPDHVDGLRVEQDGHLNHDYKKEIIIGNHEEFEQAGSDKKLVARLKIIFIKADVNHDGFLDRPELKSWIMAKVKEHLSEATAENAKIFSHLDTDSDGFVTWKEFHIHFLLAKGYKQNETLQHVDDYESLSIDSEDRERLIRYKFRWAEADEEPQDNQLTISEMQDFRHPEQSSKMIVRMAKDIIENLDHDEDGIITKEEFVALPRGEVDDMMHGEESDTIWLNERKKEFEDVIDLDHDGKVGIEELKVYVDPHNENHAHLEADNLIQLADENSDGKLSMSEVLNSAELFLGSKMVDTGRNFHDEF